MSFGVTEWSTPDVWVYSQYGATTFKAWCVKEIMRMNKVDTDVPVALEAREDGQIRIVNIYD